MMLGLKSGPQIAAKVGNPAGLLCQRIWYSVGKSGVLGITEYRQGRPLYILLDISVVNSHATSAYECELLVVTWHYLPSVRLDNARSVIRQ